VIDIKTKTFIFQTSWKMLGKTSVEVPAHLTEEEAVQYVKDNWSNIISANGLPSGEYVLDSEEPYFDVYCEFE